MSEFNEAFAAIENRGEPRSADTILSRVASQLNAETVGRGSVGTPLSDRRVRIGQLTPVLAAIGAFVLVLATGILMSALIGHRDVAPNVDSAAGVTQPPYPTLGVAGPPMVIPEDMYPTSVAQTDDSVLVLADTNRVEPGGEPSDSAVLLSMGGVSNQVELIATLSDHPLGVVVAADYAWVTHWTTGALTRIPLTGDRALTSVDLPTIDGFGTNGNPGTFLPNDIETVDGIVWVLTARGALVGVNANSGETQSIIELDPPHPLDLSAGLETVWIAEDVRGIEWVDTLTGTKSRLPVSQLGHLANHVAAFNRKAFVSGQLSGPDGTPEAHGMSLIDADTQTAIRILQSDTPITSLGVIGNAAIAINDSGVYWIISQDGTVTPPRNLETGISPRIVYDSGDAWSIDYESRTVTKLQLLRP